MQKNFALDLVERSGWSGAETALAVAGAGLADVSIWWAAPAALVLAAAKSWVAGHVGRPGTASTLPASADPASASTGV
ncbi:hypothetical protein [Streptomyces sp. NPDC060198]|uniref:hypothetical protein n=1 Tax=Streptomyces sp. NPDC060198 TaxID=3347070 RepID=UPI003650E63B